MSNNGNQSQQRHRRPPSDAGVSMGEASLFAIDEMCRSGMIPYVNFNAGKIWNRKEVESMLTDVSHRARQILECRHTGHFFKTPYGKQLRESWYNVPLREVIYALSTAHPNCLRAFRVFHGKTMEWVGDNSHRQNEDVKDSSDSTRFDQDIPSWSILGTEVHQVPKCRDMTTQESIVPPDISKGGRSQADVLNSIP